MKNNRTNPEKFTGFQVNSDLKGHKYKQVELKNQYPNILSIDL